MSKPFAMTGIVLLLGASTAGGTQLVSFRKLVVKNNPDPDKRALTFLSKDPGPVFAAVQFGVGPFEYIGLASAAGCAVRRDGSDGKRYTATSCRVPTAEEDPCF